MFSSRIFNLLSLFLHILPVSQKKAFFISFGGQYNDNPKAISIELHKTHPEIQQYWLITKKSKKNDIPKYIRSVDKNTFKYAWVINRCKFIIDNSAGYYFFVDKKPNFFKRRIINKKQFNLSTWHGFPIKTIGCKMIGNEWWSGDYLYSSSNVLLAGCDKLKNIFSYSYFDKIRIEVTGSPRNDVFFNLNQEDIFDLKLKLGLPINKKIFLYVPTFRNTIENSGIKQLLDIDFDRFYASLSSKFGGEWVMVFRAHNLVFEKLNNELPEYILNRVIPGNTFDDMAEYLVVSDAVMTDYSGCLYDFLLTQKPCFIHAHDLENYKNEERGLETSITMFPYPISTNFDELLENIEQYNLQKVNAMCSNLLTDFGSKENGDASKKAVEILERNMNA